MMSSKGETEADSGTVSPNLSAVKNEPVSSLNIIHNMILIFTSSSTNGGSQYSISQNPRDFDRTCMELMSLIDEGK